MSAERLVAPQDLLVRSLQYAADCCLIISDPACFKSPHGVQTVSQVAIRVRGETLCLVPSHFALLVGVCVWWYPPSRGFIGSVSPSLLLVWVERRAFWCCSSRFSLNGLHPTNKYLVESHRPGTRTKEAAWATRKAQAIYLCGGPNRTVLQI